MIGRKLALYYFGATGASVYGVRLPGFSVGARIGLALSKDLEYIIALGGDVDVTPFPKTGSVGVFPSLYISLLSFGSL